MCEKGGNMDLVCGPGTDGGGKYFLRTFPRSMSCLYSKTCT